jgi:transposase
VIVDKEVFIMSSLSFDDAHAKYGVGQTCLYMWLREYERSVGAAAPAKPAKQEIPSDYSAMSKDELIKEPMGKASRPRA